MFHFRIEFQHIQHANHEKSGILVVSFSVNKIADFLCLFQSLGYFQSRFIKELKKEGLDKCLKYPFLKSELINLIMF